MHQSTFGDTSEGSYCDPNVYQYYSDTCAIQSQRLILEKYGIEIDQDSLIEEAELNGWYKRNTGQGTMMSDVGKLLENHGVDVNISDNNNIFSLVNELAQNHQVIVAVDSSELWEGSSWLNSLEDYFMGDVPDHALIVSGLDASDPNNIQVVLTDPGTGDVRIRYSEAEFLDAWKDSNCWMMSTQEAPPAYDSSLWDTDYSFAGIPSNVLQQLGNTEMDVRSEEYSSFVGSLCETPDMPWEEIVSAIGIFLVKEVIHDIFSDESDGLGSGLTPYNDDMMADSGLMADDFITMDEDCSTSGDEDFGIAPESDC